MNFRNKTKLKDLSTETTLALIDEVRKRPILYADVGKKSSPEFPAAWEEVSKALGDKASLASLKELWQLLRSAHGRFLQVGHRISIPGANERLSFLNEYMALRQRKREKNEESLENAIQLVNIVREFPCLYDGSSDTAASCSAWRKVSIKLGGGAIPRSCILRWERIRYFYTFYLKRGDDAKPEGIAPYLDFLNPFVSFEPNEAEEYETTKQLAGIVRQYPALYDGSQSGQNVGLWNEVAQHMGNQVSAESCITKWAMLRDKYKLRRMKFRNSFVPLGIDRHLTFLDAFLQPAAVQGVKHLHVDATDPDVQFLLRFTDTMARMSGPQKRNFKISALKASKAVRDGGSGLNSTLVSLPSS